MPPPSPTLFRLTWRRGPRPFGSAEIVGILGLIAVAVAVAFPHLPVLQQAWPGCAFRELTGWPCGACGLTRSFVRATHGELASALVVSPLGLALLAAWVGAALVILPTWAVPSLPRPHLVPAGPAGAFLVRWGLLALLLVNWAYLLAYTAIAGSPPP